MAFDPTLHSCFKPFSSKCALCSMEFENDIKSYGITLVYLSAVTQLVPLLSRIAACKLKLQFSFEGF